MTSRGGYIGAYAGQAFYPASGFASIDGSGSSWVCSGDIFVAGSSTTALGNGTLSASNGGQVTLEGVLKLWDSAKLTIDGGSVSVAGLEGTNGSVVTMSDSGTRIVLTIGGTEATSFSGILKDGATGVASIRKVGTGLQSLLGDSSAYSGTIYVDEGTLEAGHDRALGTGGVTVRGGELHINSGVRIENPISLEQGTVSGFGIIAGDLVVSEDSVFARIESVIDGSDGLTKAGSGILELTGANIYVGGTVINGGTLLVNNTGGSGTGEGTVTVNSGGILGGSGSMLGAMIVAQGGVVAPGNSPGTLTGTDALFEGGGGYQFEVNQADGDASADPGWDLLALSGSLTIEATSANPFVIDVTSLALDNTAGVVADFDPFHGYLWTLVTAADGIIGFDPSAFLVKTDNFANELMGGTFFVTADANNLHLQFNPVPEPSSATALLGMALVGGLLHHRKRRREGAARRSGKR